MRYNLFRKFIIFIITFNFSIIFYARDNLCKLFSLKKDLEIVDFGEVMDISIDKEGKIYIFDSPSNVIKVFNDKGHLLKSIGRKGHGPGEFPADSTFSMAIDSQGKVIVLDKIKEIIQVYSEQGKFLRSWRVGFNAIGILIDTEDNVIIIGLKNNRIFHVYTEEGNLVYSFGAPFSIPSKYSKYKNYPNWKVPNFAFFSKKTNRIYACHPFSYEIWASTKEHSEPLISRKVDFFKPFHYVRRFGKELKIRSMFPIFEKGEFLFVVLPLDVEKESYIMDIFKNYKYIGYIPVKGYLKAIDIQGRFYFIEEDFSKVVRYILIERK